MKSTGHSMYQVSSKIILIQVRNLHNFLCRNRSKESLPGEVYATDFILTWEPHRVLGPNTEAYIAQLFDPITVTDTV
ncbi:MAG: hypothetical protein KC964_05630, partial [Candidatus Omnitrophica bacterium]|nr:hypothetical protein [Candidatus Omnitrophota bacterium]